MNTKFNTHQVMYRPSSVTYSHHLSAILTAIKLITFLITIVLSCRTMAEDRFIPPGFFDDLNSLNLNEVPRYDELPVSIRREVPRPKLSVHYYDDNPDKRYALINHYRAYEGLPIGQELWVYQIVPEGIIIKYIDRYFFVEK